MFVEPSLASKIVSSIAECFARPPEPVREMRPVEEDEHPVIRALRRAGRPLTNQELARFLNCSEGQASKLRRKVKDRLIEWRQGKYVLVTIADFHELPKVSARKPKRNKRKS